MKSSLKICCLIPSLQAGGMERVMSQLLHKFAAREGTELHLVLFGMDREIFYNTPSNITIHRPSFTFDNRYRLWFTLRTLWFLRRQTFRIDPDTILSFGEYWNNFVLLALRGTGYPVYISDRCRPNKSLGRLQDQLRRWLYPSATGVIAQTARAREIYRDFFQHSRVAVIGNPIRRIGNVSEENRENIVLSVGRLIETKHHDKLIELFLRVQRKDWKLVIVGADALKQQNMKKLQNLIDGSGASGHVVLAGQQSDVDSYYRRSKIFAFTSSSEGFPNVIGEALSAGLPVVAFDCIAGPSDLIIDGENGFLINLFNYTEFEKKLMHLMDDEALRQRMSSQAPASVGAFAADRIADKYYRFITSHF